MPSLLLGLFVKASSIFFFVGPALGPGSVFLHNCLSAVLSMSSDDCHSEITHLVKNFAGAGG